MCIYYSFEFSVFMGGILECANEIDVCVLCALLQFVCFVLLICLFGFTLLYYICFCSLGACLFSKERQKVGVSG